MKKTIFHIIAALGSLILVFSECVKETNEGDVFRPAGTKISFSATTKNGNGTRTVYSGYTYTSQSSLYERIDWVSGDKIKIIYNNAENSESGVYEITGIDSTNPADAGIVYDSGTELEWGSSGTHQFYGIYPSTANLTSAGRVTGSLPKSQTVKYNNSKSKYFSDMNLAYMISYAGNSQVNDNTVTLPFTPVVTAFEIKLKLEGTGPSLGVNRVLLTSKDDQGTTYPLTGGFVLDINGYSNGAVTYTNYNTNGTTYPTIIADFVDENNNTVQPGLSSSTDLDFTFFALPRTISYLTLEIEYTDGTVKKVKLKDNNGWKSFAAGQKHVISNYNVPNLDYEYIINTITSINLSTGHSGGTGAINVQSYKRDYSDPNNIKPVPWKMQYSTDGGQTWSNFTSTGNNGGNATDLSNNTWSANAISGSGASLNNGSLSNEPSTLTMPGTDSREAHIDPAGLDAVTPVGLTTRVDLSLNGTGGARNTANCYIVTGPGHYMFPCVYGNGIRNGAQNYSAFWPFLALDSTIDAVSDDDSNVSVLSNVQTVYNTNSYSANYYTPALFNALGEPVSGPIAGHGGIATASPEYIIDDLGQYGSVSASAAVLWQDVPQGDEIIPYDNQHVGITTVNNKHFIWFNIDADRIKPGNVVIALRGTISGHYTSPEVLWSWHIWIPEDAVTYSNSFMNRNLGQVSQSKVTKYADRSLTFRIATVEEDGQGNPLATEEFTFSQVGDSSSETINRNTYYQWGRKDPMINTNSDAYVSFNPAIFDVDSNNSNLRDPDDCFTSFQTFTGVAKGATGFDRSRGIRAPYYLLKNNSTDSWLDGAVYPYYTSSTTITTYTITNQRTHFPLSQASNLNNIYNNNNVAFSVSTNWTEEYGAGYYVPQGNSIRNQSTQYYTEVQFNWLTKTYYFVNGTQFAWTDDNSNAPTAWLINPYKCLAASDFSGSGNKRVYNGSKRGPFTTDQKDYLNTLPYNNNSATSTWDYYSESQVVFSGTYNTGPYSSTARSSLLQNGFSSSDFSSSSTYSYGAAYTYTYRSDSSIPYNLWNSYLYSENPSCTNAELHDDNKFKTIYDPCPPGYTVPTKNELSVSEYLERGSLPSSSSVNGYWTDHPRMIDAINANGNLASISNFQYYNQAYMKIVGGSGATGASRGIAASIRPMLDPKVSGVATSLAPSPGTVTSPTTNPIEGVEFGSDLQ